MNDQDKNAYQAAEIARLNKAIEWIHGQTGKMMGEVARAEIVGAVAPSVPAPVASNEQPKYTAELLTELRRWAGDDAGYASCMIRSAANEIERLVASSVPQLTVPQGYVLALQTVVEMPDGAKELGYTVLSGVGIFTSQAEVSEAIADLSLPLGWVSMTTSQLLPGWMLPAAPDVAPLPEQTGPSKRNAALEEARAACVEMSIDATGEYREACLCCANAVQLLKYEAATPASVPTDEVKHG